jgi:ketose-bisphosphate aldolase
LIWQEESDLELQPLSKLLSEAQKGGYAVGSFDCFNAETMQAVVEAAVEMRSPAILMAAPMEIAYMGPRLYAAIARELAKWADVPLCLHLDHTRTVEELIPHLEAGFTSVMLDGSLLPFEENVRLTREAVQLARRFGASCEGELGAVGHVSKETIEVEGGSEESRRAEFTNPDEARLFVEQTGIDALAVYIGNAHGIYRARPKLDFELLAQLSEAAKAPLVLHGGSGTPEEDLKRAVQLGIRKVNVASELAKAVTAELTSTDSKVFWPPLRYAAAKAAVKAVAAEWMKRLGSAGKV